MDVHEVIRKNNYKNALHMLCIKMGWTKEYSWYIMRREPDMCRNGGRAAFIKKATRLLAFNYEGIHTGAEPSLSPRLLPSEHPLSQPIRFPPEFEEKSK